MPTPIIGLGTVVTVDAKTIDLIVNAKPPMRDRELVDITTLDATLQIYAPGIEKHSEFTFRLLRDPDDTDQTSLDTLFGSKAIKAVTVTYTDATPTVQTFSGFVSKIEPSQIEHNQPNAWDVTIQRTSAFT
jgi:hypothetical protein